LQLLFSIDRLLEILDYPEVLATREKGQNWGATRLTIVSSGLKPPIFIDGFMVGFKFYVFKELILCGFNR